MRVSTRKRWAVVGAAALVLPIALAACGGDDDAAEAAGAVKVFGCEPQNPLIPTNTNEVCGGNILDNVFTGLVNYDPDTAEPENAVAESIESDDNKLWTVKLNDNYTFHDGTKVTAKSFVDAWNWGADETNAQLNSYFFCGIAGSEKTTPVTCAGKDEGTKPSASTLDGLKVVSDTEFTVQLTDPASSFPVQLGYTAFDPLPASFFDSPKAFGAKPIGNGPFKVVKGTPRTGFTLEAYDAYEGPNKPTVKTVEFKTYKSPQAGYADMQADNGSLDLMDQVPPAALAQNRYQKQFPGRYVNKTVGIFQSVTLPEYVDGYDDPNLGKALSMAIDRPTITQKVFNGGRTPASGWVSPVVQGFKAGACDPYCTYDPAKAKEAFADAKYKGPFTFSYNADGPGNKEAAEAVCNSIKNTLDVECNAKAYVNFQTFRTAVVEREMTSMFRTGWQMDYPSMENFLAPLYVTNASANDGGFSNKEFDALITKAAGEKDDASLATYQQAEKLLAEKMSIIPLWYQAQQSVWSSRVEGVKVTPFSTFDLSTVRLKSEAVTESPAAGS